MHGRGRLTACGVVRKTGQQTEGRLEAPTIAERQDDQRDDHDPKPNGEYNDRCSGHTGLLSEGSAVYTPPTQLGDRGAAGTQRARRRPRYRVGAPSH